MKNLKNQTGSAHVIIVIILILALIGSLGFIFWQNFVKNETNKQSQNSQTDKKTTDNNTKTDSSKTEVKLTEIAADDLVGTDLAVKYPKDWIVTHKEYTGSDAGTPLLSKIYTITSPDNSLTVKFDLTNMGRGGTCDGNDDPSRTITQLDKSTIPSYNNVFFVSYSDDQGAFFAGAMKNTEIAQAVKIGDSSCSVTSFKQLSGLVFGIDNSKSIDVTMNLSIEFNNIKAGASDATQKFRQELTTDNYKTAKKIIESLYVKN